MAKTKKGRNGMYGKTLVGLLAIAMTAGAFGGTFTLFDVAQAQQERFVA